MLETGKDLVTKFQSESSGFWKDWGWRTMELPGILFCGHTQSVGKKMAEIPEEGLGAAAFALRCVILRWKLESFMRFL